MDRIDEMNKQAKMKRSIVKYWQVHYVKDHEEEALSESPQEEMSEESIEEIMTEEMDKAREVYERLRAEAEADERRKQEELMQAYKEAEIKERQSHAQNYGSRIVESVEEQEQIRMILDEKEAQIRSAFNEYAPEENIEDEFLSDNFSADE